MSILDDTDTRLGIGGNNPPSDADVFEQKMREQYPETFSFAERLLKASDRIPTQVDDDDTAGKVSDFIKQVKSAQKSLDAARVEEKEVYVRGGRMVDGMFKNWTEKLKTLVNSAAEPLAEYQKKKEDEERRRREEEAQRKREEAEAALREAERKRKEAEEKERIAKEEQARAHAEAEARRKAIEEEAARKKAEQEAEIQRLKDEKAASEKADKEKQAELKRQLDEANEKLKATKSDEREQLKAAKQDANAAEDAAHELAKQAKSDNREANKLIDTAIRTDKQAEKLDKLANKDAADLARIRGREGSVATVQTLWVGTVTNREIIDLEALRQHFKDDDIQIALNSWVKANPGKQLRGAFIREENRAIVR